MSKYDPLKHHRRSIRLRGYDYRSPGAYFVTICTRNRECLLDDPVIAGIICDVWHALPRWFPTISLDEFVIMPNHIHFIVWLHPERAWATLAVALDARRGDPCGRPSGAGASPAPTTWRIPDPEKVNHDPKLGDVVGAFQSLVFRVYLDWVQDNDPSRQAKFWQRNYYEHIIRNTRELEAIRQYIRLNPDNWAYDRDNPVNLRNMAPPKTAEEYVREALNIR